MMSDLNKMLHTVGFWMLVFFILGMAFGGYLMYKINERQLVNAAKVGAMIITVDGVERIYDWKQRP